MENILALPSSEKTGVALADNQSREMGEQLTEQFEKATGGMREVLIFGAMMMRLRSEVLSTVDKTGAAKRGPAAKGTGIDAWLKHYAPSIPHASAYRFEAVAMGVADKWGALPDSLAKKIEFPELVTFSEPKLAKIDKRLPKKRVELFDYVKGTSQKSFLDQFRDKYSSRGGNKYERGGDKGKRRGITQAQLEKFLREGWIALAKSLRVQTKESTFVFLTDGQLDAVLEVLSSAETALRDWRSKPKRERDELFAAALAKAARHHKK
jgi:hypothetical protein